MDPSLIFAWVLGGLTLVWYTYRYWKQVTGLSARRRRQLFHFLAHGSPEHRTWLKEAIDAFFDNKPRPPERPALDEKSEL